jgi:nitrogen regulatory protein PII
MELLVCVINREEKVDEILSGFLDLGVKGATVVGSEGMGRLVSRGVPVLAGLQELLSLSRPNNTTIFSVIETKEKAEAAVRLIERIAGDLDDPGSGIVFTVPVTRTVGLARDLGTPPD